MEIGLVIVIAFLVMIFCTLLLTISKLDDIYKSLHRISITLDKILDSGRKWK